MNETTLTIPLPPQVFWGLALLLCICAASAVVFGIMPRNERSQTPIARLQALFGLNDLPGIVFLVAALLWLGLFLSLVAGLYYLIFEIWTHPLVPRPDGTQAVSDANWEWRFKLVQVTALTTVLGAVVVLPITLNRLRLQREGNETERESLFNEKINAATEDLYARRQRSIKSNETYADVWEDDITRRNAAIDRLYGLVVENPDEAERVSRLLSVYVRELSAKGECPAVAAPEFESQKQIREWARGLLARSDMENAVQVLGRLRGIEGVKTNAVRIDLRGANLQGMDFAKGDFEGALMQGAQLQGAKLGGARLQGANLLGAQLQGADLFGAQVQGAVLRGAQLQGARLGGAQLQGANLGLAQLQGANLAMAQLQGANLGWAQLDDTTDLRDATLRGAALYSIDDTTMAQLEPFLGGYLCGRVCADW